MIYGLVIKLRTLPGIVSNPLWPQVPIFDQHPSILGWTCGNMVGATKDVAAWFYDLLAPDTANPKIVSDAARAEMMRLETLTAGWAKGKLKYGAGLMETSVPLVFAMLAVLVSLLSGGGKLKYVKMGNIEI